MKKEYKLFTTQDGFDKAIMQHWLFRYFGPLFLTLIWRLASSQILLVLWFVYIAVNGTDESEWAYELVRIPWYVDLLVMYVSVWLGSKLWKRREKKMKHADPPLLPLMSWWLEFGYGLGVFIVLQLLIVGIRMVMF